MPPVDVPDVDLSASEFWGLPLPQRRDAFARLRSLPQPPFFADPDVPFATSGEGYYALVRHADVVEASRNPEVFCSGQGRHLDPISRSSSTSTSGR